VILDFGLAAVLSRLSRLSRHLERLVEQRTAALAGEVAQRQQAESALHRLSAQLADAEETQRRRIAQEIHDALGQMLSLVKLNVETVLAEAPADSGQWRRLAETAKMLQELIQQSRTLIFELHPSMLEDLGLAATLQNYGRQFSALATVEVTVTETGQHRRLPGGIAGYLFRAVKEAMNNAVKHGRAKEIVVTLHWTASGLRIVVDDDGAGFDTEAALAPETRRGMGLPWIAERLTSLGGRLNIESKPGQGSRLILELPLAADDPAGNT
jgi:signal transduction histidine kinase